MRSLALVSAVSAVFVVACSKGGSAPDAGSTAAADAAPAPAPKAAARVVLDVTGTLTSFEATGMVPDGALSAALEARVKKLDKSRVALRALASPTPTEVEATAALMKALELSTGEVRLEVTPERIEFDGGVWVDEDKGALEAALDDAGRVLERKVQRDVYVANQLARPGGGFVRYADGTTPKVGLTPDGGGDVVKADSAGRVPAGIYTIDGSDLRIAVAEGKVTWLRKDLAGARGVLIGGRRFALDDDITVLAPGDEGALDGTDKLGPDNLPVHGLRYAKPGEKIEVADLLAQRDTIHQVVLHFDLQDDSAAAYRELIKRSLSTHFMIDWDGTLYQMIDVGWCGYHAGEANLHSIGVDLNNLAKNVRMEADASAYPTKHPRLEAMQSAAYARTLGPAGEINGAKVQSYGFTEPQYRTLGALLRLLARVFPQLDAGPPVDDQGAVVTRTLDDPAAFRGVMGHYHWAADRWDPGPALDWKRLGLDSAPR